MSNYPPGVTGTEPQIVGNSTELQLEVDCGAGGYSATIDGDWECQFTGTVTVERLTQWTSQVEAGVIDLWTCPDCKTDHEDERTINKVDPDGWRD
jgi:hypothetical protein